MKIQPLMLILLIVLVACSPGNDSFIADTAIPFPISTATSEILRPSSTPTFLEDSQDFVATNSPTIVAVSTNTPYPTFEVQDVKTHTPFQPAQCAPENPNWKPATNISRDTMNPGDLAEIVQQDLSSGASFAQVKQVTEFVELEDLTGDRIPELVVHQFFNIVVFACDDNDYKTILDYSTIFNGGLSGPDIYAVQDMNLNGIPDVVLVYSATSGGNTVVDILEWDGGQFNSLIQANHGEDSSVTSSIARALYWYSSSSFHNWSETDAGNLPVMEGGADVVIKDVDKNGTKELILTDNGPGHADTLYAFGPWRGKQVIFKWDGIHYLYSSLEIDPPVYRFQAIQDADRLFLLGEYDKALKLYQDVISNGKLEWWSHEKMVFIRDSYFAKAGGEATPIPPQANNDEYAYLAAYARYRVVLYYLLRGEISDATTVYTSLLDNFPAGTAGSQFADVASLLWDEYQKTNSLGQACLPVINYVTSHPEILSPLGNEEHGDQSHVYIAEDLCPFK
jgi:hypothetical protein